MGKPLPVVRSFALSLSTYPPIYLVSDTYTDSNAWVNVEVTLCSAHLHRPHQGRTHGSRPDSDLSAVLAMGDMAIALLP